MLHAVVSRAVCAATLLAAFARADPLRVACIHYGNATTCRGLPWQMRHVQAALGLDVVVVEPSDAPDALFVSVLGARGGIVHTRDPAYASLLNSTRALRIYTTGENTDHLSYPSSELDLSLGVRCPSGGVVPCIRVPFWFAYAVTPTTCQLHIEPGPDASSWASRPRFATLISLHGGFPREVLFQALSTIGNVTAPGQFIHNAPSVGKGGDSKRALLATSRFNVCPENRPGDGYVTEKVVEAFQAGSIPVYWRGAGFDVEPEVFNQARIINFGLLGENVTLVARAVWELENDAAARGRFFSVPILKPGAQAHVTGVCGSVTDAFVRGMRARGLGARLESARVAVKA